MRTLLDVGVKPHNDSVTTLRQLIVNAVNALHLVILPLLILHRIAQGQFTIAAISSFGYSLLLVSVYLSHKGRLGSSVLLSAWVCLSLPFLLAYFGLILPIQIIPQLVLLMGIFQAACVNKASRYVLLFYCIAMLMAICSSHNYTFQDSLPFLFQIFALGVAVDFLINFIETQNNSLRATDEDLQDINNREHALNQSLAEKNTELTMYSNIMSHDLKSPLHIISLCSEIIGDENTSPNEIKYHSKIISKTTQSMHDLIDDMYLYSQADAHTTRDIETVNLNETLNSVIVGLDHEINSKSVKLTIDKMPTVHGDKPMLNALFRNLISNAIKFQPQNKASHIPYIKISSKLNTENQHTILFEDNGIGLPLDSGEENFEPFKRYHSTNYEGTGSGLSICKRVVQFHKGTFILKKTSEQGSCFEITLPSQLPTPAIELSTPDNTLVT